MSIDYEEPNFFSENIMEDPMARILQSESQPYGNSNTRGVLIQLFRNLPPEVMAEATGNILNRLVVLEMFLENERNISISSEDLQNFVHDQYPKIQEETEKMATLFFGSISRREGG